MTVRLHHADDCLATHADLKAPGAEFLTDPVDHGHEIRAFLRDPDGHLFKIGELVGQSSAAG